MEDKTIIIVVSSILGFFGTVFTGLLAFFMKRSDQRADAAALEVKNVADRLAVTDLATAAKLKANESKLQAIAVVADATHVMTNSQMGNALRINMKVTARLAEFTKDPADVALAEEAKLLYEAHEKQQDKVDAKFPGGIPDAAEDIVEAVTSVSASPVFSPEQSAELTRIIKESMNPK